MYFKMWYSKLNQKTQMIWPVQCIIKLYLFSIWIPVLNLYFQSPDKGFTVFPGSHISAWFKSKGSNCPFCPDYVFNDVCIVNSLGRYISASWPGQVCLLFRIIKIMFPSGAKGKFAYCPLQTWFLSPGATHVTCRCHLTLFTSPHGNWTSGNLQKWYSGHCLLMNNKLPFVSDLGISSHQWVIWN